jgi:hypothetical protein
LAIILILGIIVMALSPLLRHRRLASYVLAAGAATLLVIAILGLAFPDPRIGQEAAGANRRFYRAVLGCELPVLVFTVISWRGWKWAFWLGWGLNIVFSIFLAALVIWLKFFWHW